jgi:hypothetical protein
MMDTLVAERDGRADGAMWRLCGRWWRGPKSELELGFFGWRVLVTPLPIEDWGVRNRQWGEVVGASP